MARLLGLFRFWLLALGAVVIPPTVGAAQQSAAAPTVVELFTSQGCHSCPPADALLSALANRPDIIPLSFHVDYWDYLGWKDPFASPEATQRQRGYGQKMQLRTIYTPQMVVDGQLEFIGSRPNELAAALAQSSATASQRVRLTMSAPRAVRLPQLAVGKTYDVWHVAYDRKNQTDIPRGENANKRLTYTNSVRSLAHLGQWQGQTTDIQLPQARAANEVVLVQEVGQGPIIGAIKVP